MKKSIEKLKKRIAAAKMDIPSDLVLKGGKVVNVFSGTIEECDIALIDGVIAGLGRNYSGKNEINIKGKWVVPGLIDGHFHIESSMLMPSGLASALLPHGTTGIVSDPHEIANVLGVEGIRIMIEDSQSIPFDIYFMASSCVPATQMETSGATLEAPQLRELKKEKSVLGLAEMMNYPGVLMGLPEILEKLELFQDQIIDGHCPGLIGTDLQAYASAGISSDHETSNYDEGLEKIKAGLMLMIREGTSAKNLDALLPIVNKTNSRRCCFVSDDLHPHTIMERGHLDFSIKKAINKGLDPAIAIQMATINTAEHFSIKEKGALAPGYAADMVVLNDLKGFEVDQVYKSGALIVDNGSLLDYPTNNNKTQLNPKPLNTGIITPERFKIGVKGKSARVINLIPGQVLTASSIEEITSNNGTFISQPDKDILKLIVIERHKATGNTGICLVKGFGIKRGAIATSVAHDSHNIIALGVDDENICTAVKEVRDMGGGMAVSDGGSISARLPLPIGGLMSLEPLAKVKNDIDLLNKAAANIGCKVDEPFMSLSFLALPVIPELKLTDQGLVDVNQFNIVPLFVDGTGS